MSARSWSPLFAVLVLVVLGFVVLVIVVLVMVVVGLLVVRGLAPVTVRGCRSGLGLAPCATCVVGGAAVASRARALAGLRPEIRSLSSLVRPSTASRGRGQ